MTLFILPLFLGPTELILILLVVLLLFGGRKIPELMRGLGRGVKEFKDGEQTGKRRASGTRHPENRQASGIASGQQKPCTQRAGHTGRHR